MKNYMAVVIDMGRQFVTEINAVKDKAQAEELLLWEFEEVLCITEI